MSFTNPEEFLAQIDDEMKAQGLTSETIIGWFKEDFPQGYFLLFEEEKHTREMSDEEQATVGALFLGYATGIIRSGRGKQPLFLTRLHRRPAERERKERKKECVRS